MYIGLFSEVLNDQCPNYRGIYRDMEWVDYYEVGNACLADAISFYFENSRDGLYTEYSAESLAHLKKIQELLVAEGWHGDLLLFTHDKNAGIPKGFRFLGYDLFSCHGFFYSPLGDGGLIYDDRDVFFSEMDHGMLETYQSNINCSGLFDSYDTALHFSEYCNRINRKYPDSIEAEVQWMPFAVYIADLAAKHFENA